MSQTLGFANSSSVMKPVLPAQSSGGSVKKAKVNQGELFMDDDRECVIDTDKEKLKPIGKKVNEELKTLGPLPVDEYNSEDDDYPEYVIDSDSDFDWDKEMLKPIFPDEPIGDIDCWYRYFQQIDESEGFDIKDYPGLGSMTTIVPTACTEKRSAYAAQALVDYNEKNGTEYKFNEIVKVNGYCTEYSHFYITFTVTNTNGEKEYFQAEVMEDLDGNLEFPIVRPRAKGGTDI